MTKSRTELTSNCRALAISLQQCGQNTLAGLLNDALTAVQFSDDELAAQPECAQVIAENIEAYAMLAKALNQVSLIRFEQAGAELKIVNGMASIHGLLFELNTARRFGELIIECANHEIARRLSQAVYGSRERGVEA